MMGGNTNSSRESSAGSGTSSAEFARLPAADDEEFGLQEDQERELAPARV
jgi:hypothetical protein